jgi:hypothetical protein
VDNNAPYDLNLHSEVPFVADIKIALVKVQE